MLYTRFKYASIIAHNVLKYKILISFMIYMVINYLRFPFYIC